MRLCLSIIITCIAGSIAKSISISLQELLPRKLIAGNAELRNLNTGTYSDESKTSSQSSKTLSHTILPRGNCAGKLCGEEPGTPSEPSTKSRKSGRLSFTPKKSGGLFSTKSGRLSFTQGRTSRQGSSEIQYPQSHFVVQQDSTVRPSRTEVLQRDQNKGRPIPYPDFVNFDRAASSARPSRDRQSKEAKNPSRKPMSMNFSVQGPGTVSITSEHENSFRTESHNIEKGEVFSKNIRNKYGARVQGMTQTGAQFDLSAQRAYMGLDSHKESGSVKSTAVGPDGFRREETIQGKGRSEVELKSHGHHAFVGVNAKLEGQGGFHADSNAGIPLE